jgi:hypothetical protein
LSGSIPGSLGHQRNLSTLFFNSSGFLLFHSDVQLRNYSGLAIGGGREVHLKNNLYWTTGASLLTRYYWLKNDRGASNLFLPISELYMLISLKKMRTSGKYQKVFSVGLSADYLWRQNEKYLYKEYYGSYSPQPNGDDLVSVTNFFLSPQKIIPASIFSFGIEKKTKNNGSVLVNFGLHYQLKRMMIARDYLLLQNSNRLREETLDSYFKLDYFFFNVNFFFQKKIKNL